MRVRELHGRCPRVWEKGKLVTARVPRVLLLMSEQCEWSKHMDKHDRPYKCPAEGCEKLPGFTYSGGLLRHEREVHNKHGGPRKQLNCPHINCKRHTGKGFSRQENLNEHLRRVHTDAGLQDAEVTEDEEDTKTGGKRKRVAPTRGSGDDLREEMKRLKAENEELRRQSEAQTAQTNEMMRQIQQVGCHPSLTTYANVSINSNKKKATTSSTPVAAAACAHASSQHAVSGNAVCLYSFKEQLYL